ncbi:phosphate acyltransferase PlsX [Priestia filamentosa]|uniref:phosphate acyltransferase PlsX n=1 Tax=Priestia filamentosa TaxID=1402861 RepID=UPI0003026686|nr:phosphate acyltransferase PlsX [Priestia filamentosa]
MKITIDAMGGDHAPKAIIEGAERAIAHFPDLHIILVGDENLIHPHLKNKERITVLHTEEVIEATDEPVRAVRRKKKASMVLAAQQIADGEADACISAGNTGALMAAGLFIIGRIQGIERPALAPTLPTRTGNGFLLLDAGANPDAKPNHLLQYAIMGSIYAKSVFGIESPRVGLLNVGTEEKKGSDLTKQAFPLLQGADINFIGNIEGRDLLEGVADVVVTDGFTGNIALKSIEGTALSIFSMLKETLTSSFKSKVAAGILKPQLKKLKTQMDYTEYGGAGLFGLKAPVIKAHGSSDDNAIFNAVRQAVLMVEQSVPKTIAEQIDAQNKKQEQTIESERKE